MRSVALRTRVVSVVVLLTFQARPRSSSVYDGQNLVLAALPYTLPTWRTPALAVTVGAIAYEAHRLATCCGTSWGTLPARETPPCTKFSYRARVSARLPCNCHCGVGRMPADSSMLLRRISKAATVALPLPSQKSNLLPTSIWRPVVSSLLLRTSANEAEASE